MRQAGAFGIAVVALAGGAVAGWLAAGAHQRGPDWTVAGGDSAALQAAIRRLETQLAMLEARASGFVAPAAMRDATPAAGRLPAIDVAPDAARPDRGSSATAAFDPRRLLAEWVASFSDGGAGSEFFRMAVAAYAFPLRADLQAIVADALAPEALRLQALAMFDGGSFRGDAGTIDTLLGLLRDGGFPAGELAALPVLGRIGDGRTAELIEAVALGLSTSELRIAAFDAIVALAGSNAEVVLLRLLERAQDPATQGELLSRFTGSDPAATLRAYEIASRLADRQPRLVAAGAVGGQRGDPFRLLVRDWHGCEADDEVRSLLAAALEEQNTIPSYHPLQATGEPNVGTLASDDASSWAPASADGGNEWLELVFDPPRRADRVTITQTCVAGAITEVLVEQGGDWRTVWSGAGSPKELGPFSIDFAGGRAAVSRVKLVLDTRLTPGWNEIDAVELAGADGSGYATAAAASSWYGQGRRRRSADREMLFSDLTRFLDPSISVDK